MRRIQAWVMLVAFALACQHCHAQTCAKLQGSSWCSGILNYTGSVIQVDNCQATQESAFAVVGIIASMLTDEPACFFAFAQHSCARIYPPCAGPTQAPPQSLCDSINNGCSAVSLLRINAIWDAQLTASIGSFGPICSSTATAHSFVTASALVVPVPKCEPYAGNFCKGFVAGSGSVYVPFGQPQSATEALLSSSAYSLRVVHRTKCRDSLIQLICAAAFPPCITPLQALSPALTAPFPSLAHRSLCTTASSQCSSSEAGAASQLVFSTFGSALGFSNCSSQLVSTRTCGLVSGTWTSVPATFTDLFPSAPSLVGGLVPLQPNSGVAGAALTLSEGSFGSSMFACPPPLATIPSSDRTTLGIANGTCAVPCPTLLHTKEQVRAAQTVLQTLSFMTVSLAVFMIVSFRTFKQTRPSAPVYFFAYCMTVLGGSFLLAFNYSDDGFGRLANMRCSNSYTPSTSGFCFVNALMVIFGGLGGVCWWCISAVDLFITVQFEAQRWTKERKRIKNVIYVLYGCGYPAGVLLTAGLQGELGEGGSGVGWCFFLTSPIGWRLFYYPVAAMGLIGVSCMLFVVGVLCRTSSSSKTISRGRWRLFVKPICFVVAFLVIFLALFAHRVYFATNEDRWTAMAEEYVTCLLQTQPAAQATGITISCEQLRPQPSLVWFFLIQIAVSCGGIFYFLVYGTADLFRLWTRKLLCLGLKNNTIAPEPTSVSRSHVQSKYVATTHSSRLPLRPQAFGGSATSISSH